MRLVQAGEKTYYIKHKTNIGVYKTAPDRVCLIDTGFKGDGEKIDELICGMGWKIDHIINTHAHIDHLGGNEYLMKKYGIPAYCTEPELSMAHYPELESVFLTGGCPCRELRQYFHHPGRIGFRPIEGMTFDGLEWEYLPGHTFAMIGIRTSDNVYFTADAYLNRHFIENYGFGYIYNVGGCLGTLDYLDTVDADLFVTSHGPAEKDISGVLEANRKQIMYIAGLVKKECAVYRTMDQLVKCVFERTGMSRNISQHAIISSTLRGYLAYLQDRGEVECVFRDSVMMWKTK